MMPLCRETITFEDLAPPIGSRWGPKCHPERPGRDSKEVKHDKSGIVEEDALSKLWKRPQPNATYIRAEVKVYLTDKSYD